MLITLGEIIGLIVITLYLGYMFTGIIKIRPRTVYDMMHPRRIDWRDFKFAILVSAPAVVLHELMHKFTAMAFGFPATFYAFYHTNVTLFLAALSIFLKFISSPFILIVPGFVGIPPTVTNPLQYRLIAFAGPAVNLVLWLVASLLLKNAKLKRKEIIFLSVTKLVNMWLFIFNMLPFGPLDGAKVLFGPA